jgi:NADPH:quinone reductase-like Zn-dependent oxidoreductase
MAQHTVARASHCFPAPEGVSDVTLAALVDPGSPAWAALRSRARFLAGETVLVNGATGTAGSMAVQIAKYLGASKVIATGRNGPALERLAERGADVMLLLRDDGESIASGFRDQFSAGVDVVLDYLWGPNAGRLLDAAAKAQRAPLRFVQIGVVTPENLTLLETRAISIDRIDEVWSQAGATPRIVFTFPSDG